MEIERSSDYVDNNNVPPQTILGPDNLQCMTSSHPYSDESTISAPKTFDELIGELHKVFAHEPVNVEYVQKLMTLYVSNPSEWKKFSKFDPHRYTRNLVDAGNGRFNLMVLCWNEGQGSSIHSHADAHCFLKVIGGDVKESLYDWPDEQEPERPMVPREEAVFPTDAVKYINDSIGLHRVANPSHSEKAVTLHLYSPPYDEFQTFDQRTGHKRSARATFWSKYGKRVPVLLPSMSYDFPDTAENN